ASGTWPRSPVRLNVSELKSSIVTNRSAFPEPNPGKPHIVRGRYYATRSTKSHRNQDSFCPHVGHIGSHGCSYLGIHGKYRLDRVRYRHGFDHESGDVLDLR